MVIIEMRGDIPNVRMYVQQCFHGSCDYHSPSLTVAPPWTSPMYSLLRSVIVVDALVAFRQKKIRQIRGRSQKRQTGKPRKKRDEDGDEKEMKTTGPPNLVDGLNVTGLCPLLAAFMI